MSERFPAAPRQLPETLRDHRTAAEAVARGLKSRYRAETRFRLYGLAAVAIGMAFLAILFVTIIGKGWSVFRQSNIQLEVFYDPEQIDIEGNRSADSLAQGDYNALVKAALRKLFPDVEGRANLRELYGLVSSSAAFDLQKRVADDPAKLGTTEKLWLLASDEVDLYYKGRIKRNESAESRPLSDQQLAWADQLRRTNAAELRFNARFFSSGDSREPELAGAARWTDLIEVNINNLAAVPSIVFGLLGLAVFINFFGLPRSAPLVGGLVLTLMTLPTIIIASRAALKAVPPSIREAALGMGASQIQMVAHHVLPLAMPGMLTGTIIGMARALGESAPLLMIGMVAFIVDVPKNFFDPSTVLPVQVFIWSDVPERAFVERTSGAIIVLLAFLIVMNGLAVILRNRFERRW